MSGDGALAGLLGGRPAGASPSGPILSGPALPGAILPGTFLPGIVVPVEPPHSLPAVVVLFRALANAVAPVRAAVAAVLPELVTLVRTQADGLNLGLTHPIIATPDPGRPGHSRPPAARSCDHPPQDTATDPDTGDYAGRPPTTPSLATSAVPYPPRHGRETARTATTTTDAPMVTTREVTTASRRMSATDATNADAPMVPPGSAPLPASGNSGADSGGKTQTGAGDMPRLILAAPALWAGVPATDRRVSRYIANKPSFSPD